MRDAFTENLCCLLRQDLKDMEAGTYVPPRPAKWMQYDSDEHERIAEAAIAREARKKRVPT